MATAGCFLCHFLVVQQLRLGIYSKKEKQLGLGIVIIEGKGTFLFLFFQGKGTFQLNIFFMWKEEGGTFLLNMKWPKWAFFRHR